MRFWLDLGVDGLRLDAVPYLVERDGTNGENLPETHAFLRELRPHLTTCSARIAWASKGLESGRIEGGDTFSMSYRDL